MIPNHSLSLKERVGILSENPNYKFSVTDVSPKFTRTDAEAYEYSLLKEAVTRIATQYGFGS